MKGRPVDQLVFEHMFPKPRQPELHNFQTLLQRHLIPEVRMEVQAFYGHLDTPEAKYPGLDYANPVHRIRLSRWTWHRRLFRAFDALRLTPNEIANLTKWEGTKWAKERYEREQNIVIRDTTDDDISDWVEPEDRPDRQAQRSTAGVAEAQGESSDGNMDEDSDEELESVGVDLNERLRERVALRILSGDTSMPLDEEWEQWFKQAIESGEFTFVTRASDPQDSTTLNYSFPPRILASARAGNWNEIPESLHDLVRQSLEREIRSNDRAEQLETAASSASLISSAPPRLPRNVRARLVLEGFTFGDDRGPFTSYSSTRLPTDDAGAGRREAFRVQRTAQPRA